MIFLRLNFMQLLPANNPGEGVNGTIGSCDKSSNNNWICFNVEHTGHLFTRTYVTPDLKLTKLLTSTEPAAVSWATRCWTDRYTELFSFNRLVYKPDKAKQFTQISGWFMSMWAGQSVESHLHVLFHLFLLVTEFPEGINYQTCNEDHSRTCWAQVCVCVCVCRNPWKHLDSVR